MDVIIIGGGPAGVTAALYTARADIKTLIIYKDRGTLEKAEKIENFYGQKNPISGIELIETGLAQASRLGVEIIENEIVDIRLDGLFALETPSGTYTAKAVILATGLSRMSLDMVTPYEGRGVSYCAVCDAFFHKGRDVAVLGNGVYALSEAKNLLPLVNSVTLLTNNMELNACFPPAVQIIHDPVIGLGGGSVLETVLFAERKPLTVSGLFVAIGMAGGAVLAKKIGAATEGNYIITDKNFQTSIPGLWAAGDCIPGIKQIAKAVYEGAAAGMDVIRYIRKRGC